MTINEQYAREIARKKELTRMLQTFRGKWDGDVDYDAMAKCIVQLRVVQSNVNLYAKMM